MIASARASTRSAGVCGAARGSGSSARAAAAPKASAAPVARSSSSIARNVAGAELKSTTSIVNSIRPVVAASSRHQERRVACSATAAGEH